MFVVFLLTFLIFHNFPCNAHVIAYSRTTWGIQDDNVDIKSVNAIKEDLRRNNDDYRDKPLKSDKLFADTVDDNDISRLPARRNFEIVRDGNIFNESVIGSKLKRFTKVTSRSYESTVPIPTKYATPWSPTTEDKYEKRLRFMEKYKGLMNEFMESKKAESQTEPLPARAQDSEEAAGAAAVGDLAAGYNRALDDEIVSNESHYVPGPREMDMAPAKGGQVHGLRQKNRLCWRNVMIPEGPKYDSKGAVYLREYSSGRNSGFDYANTSPPSFLLPKCCNCCKKSVLGCE